MVQSPQQSFSSSDFKFLSDAALRILSGSTVATSTAERLNREGIDAARLATALDNRGGEMIVGDYKFKLIQADPETPDNFGVLVRRVVTSDQKQ